jgi:hypothetical protein
VADTAGAEATLRRFITTFDGKTITVPVRGSAEWTGASRAGVGIIPGAPSERDNVVYALGTGEFVTRWRVVAEPRNRAWLEYMNEGGVMPPLRGFAGGGYVDRELQYMSRASAPQVIVQQENGLAAGDRLSLVVGGERFDAYVQAQASSLVFTHEAGQAR